MNITRCPTAYALGCNSQQGNPVTVSDRIQLRRYYDRKDMKREAARERLLRVRPWERSNRNRKVIVP